jgi:hypothetical protein
VLLGAGHAEEVGLRAGGQHDEVGGVAVASSSTLMSSTSTDATSASVTVTDGRLEKIPRSGRATSISASSAVATW